MPSTSNFSDDAHLAGAAVEDEMIRLERAYRDIANRQSAADMRPIPVQAPPIEPEFRAGDPT
ncbi:hypothetical protein E1292_35260 [Nonomuraea deserti]|uniref:Uncharacterized protein n=1 Tax=Nonomuraea deserti TaxID=1848322 RepID=A0A4R4VFN9_9ACTN|nr:hypothetical protein [Nonomuraea deserti]TDC98499.1 hypothetical protein E1292_35260 [Nonomuraea deserti]